MDRERCEVHFRHRMQHVVHRLKQQQAFQRGLQGLQSVKRNSLLDTYSPDGKTAQLCHVRPAAKNFTEIVRQAANIRTLGTGYLQRQAVVLESEYLDFMHRNRPRLTHDFHAYGSGMVLALHVERLLDADFVRPSSNQVYTSISTQRGSFDLQTSRNQKCGDSLLEFETGRPRL